MRCSGSARFFVCGEKTDQQEIAGMILAKFPGGEDYGVGREGARKQKLSGSLEIPATFGGNLDFCDDSDFYCGARAGVEFG